MGGLMKEFGVAVFPIVDDCSEFLA